jgi:hypothetical protein
VINKWSPHIIRLFIITTLILFTNTIVLAKKINWITIREQTLNNNPSIKIVKLELDTAKLNYNNSISEYLPKINLHAETLETTYSSRFSPFSKTSYEVN